MHFATKVTPMKYISVLIIVFSLFVLHVQAQTTAPQTLRSLPQGELIGFIEDNGAHVWRGVPFAADTGGENRWRAPQAAPSWDGVRAGLEFGPHCPQIVTEFTQEEGDYENGDVLGDEACLNLDIYTPPNLGPDANLPIMVWIHGGSNVSGSSKSYSGHKFAVNENVIIISVQYRLGPLGWFSHPALRNSAQSPEDKAANFAILDLIAALKWLKTNGSTFGGDPDNVTIFGESAGAHNVAALMASPLAKGLFHKAIMQSGFFDSLTIEAAEGRQADEPNPSFKIAQRLGGPDAFRTVPLEEVFAAYELDDSGSLDLPRMIEDGVTLAQRPMEESFKDTENFNAVPLITGVNRDEMKLFQALDPKFTRRLFGLFYTIRDTGFYNASSEYGSRRWRVRAIDLPAKRMVAAGHDQVYAYRFDWDVGGQAFWTNFKKLLGAAHAIEIPFVFNRFVLLGQADKYMFNNKTAQERETLSRAMGRYWANFARTSVPSYKNGPVWPKVLSDQTPGLLRFDGASDGGIEIITDSESHEAILDDLLRDTRINERERCVLIAAHAVYMPEARDKTECPV